MALYNFNPGQKSWKMYANTLTSISGDDLTISPVEGRDLILEVSGNEGDIILRHGDTNVLTIDSSTATMNSDLDIIGNLDISGKLLLSNTEISGNIIEATGQHKAEIHSSSENITTNNFLKIKINNQDAWIPYFTDDPLV